MAYSVQLPRLCSVALPLLLRQPRPLPPLPGVALQLLHRLWLPLPLWSHSPGPVPRLLPRPPLPRLRPLHPLPVPHRVAFPPGLRSKTTEPLCGPRKGAVFSELYYV